MTSPELSNAKMSAWDIALTSLATEPIAFPSRLPNALTEENTW